MIFLIYLCLNNMLLEQVLSYLYPAVKTLMAPSIIKTLVLFCKTAKSIAFVPEMLTEISFQ